MKKFLLIVAFFVLAPRVHASTGTPGATGGIFYVEGETGVVGWAKGASGETISVDIYITKRNEPIDKFFCAKGDLLANQTLPDSLGRFGSKNGSLFVYNDACIKSLPDGEYDFFLALGPNLFAPGPFQISVRTINSTTRVYVHYLGVLINRIPGLYDSYPTIMKDGNIYKMWYVSPQNGDAIFYAESSDGIIWNLINGPDEGGSVLHATRNSCSCSDSASGGSCPAGDSFSIDDLHTADPSVVKVNGTYFMYYTGASKKFSCFGADNHIFLAISTDGTHWSKRVGTDGKPIPVLSPNIPCTAVSGCGYGVGQSSVIYKDNNNDGSPEFVHYFTDTTKLGQFNWAWYMATSKDGLNFTSPQYGLAGEFTWDVKYNAYTGTYDAWNAIPTRKASPGIILFQQSANGVSPWVSSGRSYQGRTVLLTMDQLTSDQSHWVIENGGLYGDPLGNVNGRNTIFYFGAGVAMQNGFNWGDYIENNNPSGETTWDMAGIDVWFVKSNILGDIDGNNRVDIYDYNRVVADFGKAETNLVTDIVPNGRVDIFDYNQLVANFGRTL